MKIAITVAASLFAASALAQTSTMTTTETTGSISISPSQETEIRQIITRAPSPGVTIRERVTVGGTLPSEIELQTLPEEIVSEVPTVRSYRYVRTGEGIALIEPDSRRVVRIIESR